MHSIRLVFGVAVAACLILSLGCSKASQTIDPAKLQAFAPLPDVVPPRTGDLTEEKVTLGRMLYYEPRLSKSQRHLLQQLPRCWTQYGVDNEPTSTATRAQQGQPQLAHRLQRRRPFRAVLGRPRRGRGGAGQGAGHEPGRDGHAEREACHRRAEVHAGVRARLSRRPSPRTRTR